MAKKQKLNLIEELTTHKCDYQSWPLNPAKPINNFRSNEEPVVKPPAQWIQIDPQSHAPYSPSAHLPFDLYFAPKPIIGKDPRECFAEIQPSKKSIGRKKIPLGTVPSPNIRVDEIESEEDLKAVFNYTYCQMHKVLMEEAAMSTSKKITAPKRVVVEGDDLRYKPVLYPKLPPGWVTAARHWDALQSRGLGDPSTTFWKRRGPEIKCGCHYNPLTKMLPQETVDEIKNLINEDKLTVAYDVTKTGYCGYRPICAKGVPLEKKNTSTNF